MSQNVYQQEACSSHARRSAYDMLHDPSVLKVYSVPREKTSPIFANAFAAGAGGIVVTEPEHYPGPAAFFGSPRIWDDVIRTAWDSEHDWYYGDHAYFGRGQYFRITRNALQHDGRGFASPGRFHRHGIPISPWREDGRHVLVCPVAEDFARLFNFSAEDWLQQTLNELAQYTDRPVRVRHRRDARPLAEDLQNCWAMVTYVSNAAVEAVLAGVPVFPTETCAASEMGFGELSLIETPLYPSDEARLQWASNLAANQWTLDEIAAGEAWSALRYST